MLFVIGLGVFLIVESVRHAMQFEHDWRGWPSAILLPTFILALGVGSFWRDKGLIYAFAYWIAGSLALLAFDSYARLHNAPDIWRFDVRFDMFYMALGIVGLWWAMRRAS